MNQNSIRQVVEDVRNGNRESFRILVVEYQSRLRMFLRAILWDGTQADDLAQETFVTAFLRIDTYEPTRSEFYAWLKGIARNLAANANRKTKTKTNTLENYLSELRIRKTWDTSEKEEARLGQIIERLRICLGRLPEKLRSLFREYYTAEKTTTLIARESGMSLSAIKVSLMRGRQMLRLCMTQAGEDVT